MPKLSELLAVNLAKLRKLRQWTQEELAQRSGMSRGTIARFETSGDVMLADMLAKEEAKRKPGKKSG